jgi:prepilin-type N-terminal cleavage/methylation domain-containing protein
MEVKLKGHRGFTLIEMLVVSLIISIVVAATGQAVRLVLLELKHTEKRQMALDESLDLDFYVRRANKNIANSRINNLSTFVSTAGVFSPRGPNLPGRPFPSMVIEKVTWVPTGSVNPLFAEVNTHFTTPRRNVFLDSFTLEEHRLVQLAGTLDKRTRRLVISRCDTWDKYIDLSQHRDDPSLTAYYLLAIVEKRPFLKNNAADPIGGLNCCPVATPNCTNAQVDTHYFRSYVINLDDAERVVSIEEFPKSTADNSIVASGFAMFFPTANSTSTDVRTFTIKNRCQTNSKLNVEVCSQKLTSQQFFEKAIINKGLIQLQLRTVGVRLSNDIAQTGVISL